MPRLLFVTKFEGTGAAAASCRSGNVMFVVEDMICYRHCPEHSSLPSPYAVLIYQVTFRTLRQARWPSPAPSAFQTMWDAAGRRRPRERRPIQLKLLTPALRTPHHIQQPTLSAAQYDKLYQLLQAHMFPCRRCFALGTASDLTCQHVWCRGDRRVGPRLFCDCHH